MAMKTVCVTGASGFIASWLVKFLLQRGYTVKASVRDTNDPRKTEHLMALEGAKERLHLMKANLLEEGAFDAIVDGCDGVFHTATPVRLELQRNNPQEEFIDPAVKGTLNVLGSCAKTPSVKRVVLTSSVASVHYNERTLSPEVIVDETWWSDLEFCKRTQLWYMLAKTLAEDAAWKFAKEKGIDLVVINPGFVIGPLLQPALNSSSAMLLNLVNGSETYMNISWGVVNVKDVANAHILAFEKPEANGRYILADFVAHFSDLVNILREMYPNLKFPQRCAEYPLAPTYQLSTKRAESLGVEFTPLKESLKETVESLIQKNFLKAP